MKMPTEKRMELILYELEQCRNDERASKDHMFQVFAATATFFAILAALYPGDATSGGTQTEGVPASVQINLIIVVILCAIIPYIGNLGLMNVFRHHRVIELEGMLRELEWTENEDDHGADEASDTSDDKDALLQWETITRPLITLNSKHVTNRYSTLYYLNYMTSLAALIAIPVLYVAYFVSSSPQDLKFNLILLGGLVLVLLPVIRLLVLSVTKSSDMYEKIKEHASGKKTDSSVNGAAKLVGYLIYPRPGEIQKNLFTIIGFIYGILCQWAVNGAEKISPAFLRDRIDTLVLAIFVIDFLVYQARYQWNDIRGYTEDRKHVEGKSRKRLGNCGVEAKTAVLASCAVMLIRLVAAAVIICKFAGDIARPSAVCAVSMLLLAVIYEFVRAKKCKRLTIFVVCWGYPLRLLYGLWAAWPQMHTDLLQSDQLAVVTVGLLIATTVFGGLFVSMTWLLEAVSNKINGKNNKPHLKWLYSQLDAAAVSENSEWDEKHPLRGVSSVCLLCNQCFVAVEVLFFVLTVILSDFEPHLSFWCVVVFVLNIEILPTHEFGKRCLLAAGALLLGLFSSAFISGMSAWINGFLILTNFGYVLIYCCFANANYTELYEAFGKMFRKAKEIAVGCIQCVSCVLLGSGGTEMWRSKGVAKKDQNEKV